jgi:hypothetical protein
MMTGVHALPFHFRPGTGLCQGAPASIPPSLAPAGSTIPLGFHCRGGHLVGTKGDRHRREGETSGSACLQQSDLPRESLEARYSSQPLWHLHHQSRSEGGIVVGGTWALPHVELSAGVDK